jgi:hypothetical protein
VRKRRQERDGSWWYWVELPLYAVAEVRGRFTAEPSPAVLAAPAAACTPIEGQDYAAVPTERPGRTPAWCIEQRLEVNAHGCRWELVHLKASLVTLERRLAVRNELHGANSVSVSGELLDQYFASFEEPIGEGERVILQQ